MQNSNAPDPGPYNLRREIASFIFDLRFLQVIGQLIFVIILVAVFSLVLTDMLATMDAQGLTPDFSFFQNRAGFDIGESPDFYTPDSSYWQAFGVGFINTLRVVIAGLIGATLLGILVGIFLLSSNYLLRSISRVYVEILRNTPLLVQLFVWYFVFVLSLPIMREALALPSEGVVLIPFRFGFYLVALFALLRIYPRGHERRWPLLLGLFALIIAAEYAFASFYNIPLDAAPAGVVVGINADYGIWSLHGVGNLGYGAFQLYVVVSVALIMLVGFSINLLDRMRNTSDARSSILGVSPLQLRNLLLALAIGQLLGGLLFYFGAMPRQTFRFEVYPLIYLSNRGFVFPEIQFTPRVGVWLIFVVVGIIVSIILWVYQGHQIETSGHQHARVRNVILTIAALAALGWLVMWFTPLPDVVPVDVDGAVVMVPLQDAIEDELLSDEQAITYSRHPLLVARPQRKGLRFGVGMQLSPEYVALFLGLTIYTSAFIAEIVRAGIQAVPRGQIEASRALGFTQSQTLRMIVIPQALRVIIPPLGNQYLNLAKNSSLAIAIGYADFYNISTTVMNQSGQSVTGMVVVMASYLLMSLTISGMANLVNRRFQLVTR